METEFNEERYNKLSQEYKKFVDFAKGLPYMTEEDIPNNLKFIEHLARYNVVEPIALIVYARKRNPRNSRVLWKLFEVFFHIMASNPIYEPILWCFRCTVGQKVSIGMGIPLILNVSFVLLKIIAV